MSEDKSFYTYAPAIGKARHPTVESLTSRKFSDGQKEGGGICPTLLQFWRIFIAGTHYAHPRSG